MWAENNSRAYFYHVLKDPGYKKAEVLVKGFVALKQKIFRRLKAHNVEIPERANKKEPLLETILKKDLPPDLKREVERLIRVRERCIPYVIPILKKCAGLFLMNKLKLSESRVKSVLRMPEVEEALARAVRQGLDRTDPEKPNIRLDFVFSALTRTFNDIFRSFNSCSITSDRNSDYNTEIQEWKIDSSLKIRD